MKNVLGLTMISDLATSSLSPCCNLFLYLKSTAVCTIEKHVLFHIEIHILTIIMELKPLLGYLVWLRVTQDEKQLNMQGHEHL